jgi:hypothetical protein
MCKFVKVGPQKNDYNCPTFTTFIFLTCTYIVSFVCVFILSQGVPDDDPIGGSKHVGLTYNCCDL